jgi:hypothetical protein
MRPSLISLSLLALLTASAASADPLRYGGDVGLLMRDEAGGNRSVLLSLRPRASYALNEHVGLAAQYGFAWSSGGTLPRSLAFHHQLLLRPEASLRLRAATFILGAGPAFSLIHGGFSDRSGASISSAYLRAGAGAMLAVDLNVGGWKYRVSTDAHFISRRIDLLFAVGVTLPERSAP